jgi:hypothetical protein
MALDVHTVPPTTRRPALERLVLALLAFLGVTATLGGGAFVIAPVVVGEGQWFPQSWLEDFPLIDSWVVLGLVLGLGFGVGSLLTWWGMLRRPDWWWTRWASRLTGQHWSWLATVLLGAGHCIWIGLELAFIPLSFFHVVYGAVGLVLLTLPFTRSVREDLAA